MPEVGETLLTFDRTVAEEYLIDFAYFQIAKRVAIFHGPLAFIAAYLSKIVLGWFFRHTSEGAKRVEILVSSMLKEKAYKEVRQKIESKGEMNDKEKKQAFKEYLPIARRALTL